jgi:hypothetical protein
VPLQWGTSHQPVAVTAVTPGLLPGDGTSVWLILVAGAVASLGHLHAVVSYGAAATTGCPPRAGPPRRTGDLGAAGRHRHRHPVAVGAGLDANRRAPAVLSSAADTGSSLGFCSMIARSNSSPCRTAMARVAWNAGSRPASMRGTTADGVDAGGQVTCERSRAPTQPRPRPGPRRWRRPGPTPSGRAPRQHLAGPPYPAQNQTAPDRAWPAGSGLQRPAGGVVAGCLLGWAGAGRCQQRRVW